jgi:Rrf2 family transcriptional regulator, iron-sulfur cluster assembly transcription factor
MMELTRKAEYAVRGMLYLGKHQEGQLAMIGDIADAMDAPRTFLAKIFQDLAKKDWLSPVRGSGADSSWQDRPRRLRYARSLRP